MNVKKTDPFENEKASIIKRLNRNDGLDKIFRFSNEEIALCIEKKCLVVNSKNNSKANFIMTYPSNRVFLLSDGDKIYALAKFISSYYLPFLSSGIQRRVYIRKVKDGLYLEESIKQFSMSAEFSFDYIKPFL